MTVTEVVLHGYILQNVANGRARVSLLQLGNDARDVVEKRGPGTLPTDSGRRVVLARPARHHQNLLVLLTQRSFQVVVA